MLARIMETCERREFIAATEAFGEKPRAIHLRSQPGSGQILAPSEFGVLGIPGNQIINIGFRGSTKNRGIVVMHDQSGLV